jgi:hypothetical protein
MASQPFDTSSPRRDMEGSPEAVERRPTTRGEISLQQCDATKLFQWHVRTAVYWRADGQPFRIGKATAPANAAPTDDESGGRG